MQATKVENIAVEVKTLSLCCKVRDQFQGKLLDEYGEVVKDFTEGICVPSFMPGDHYGDYIEIDIDVDTGKITNWKKPTEEQMDDFIQGGEG